MTIAPQKLQPVGGDDGLLEICVDNAAGLLAAIEGGADRIELCSALSVGGLTPSFGFMRFAGQQAVAVSAMIRPRAGGFCFSGAEIDIMKHEIDAAREAGLSGVVIGVTRENGALDAEVLRDLHRHAQGLDVSLHRAFDVVPDQAEALETAIELGFTRILTSGGKPTALEGLERLCALVDQAKGRISIMPGSGVRPETAGALLDRLAISEIHASCAVRGPEQDPQLVELSFAAKQMLQTDVETVKRLKGMLSESRIARRFSR
ncbi:copper homeostasis protein CutC [Rhizobium oryzicola]|uniref:PF03932 family protein CutC n=1 Tax=Rhizobium oryzicola TaxID=1232668 RepID=A0ABT8SZ53_9HYPH|nr:copper homeostasis protein CutC [Rhizobium oryzicola]MDO1583550.1 copper homeostasis protein CutC [Rhizobium oryzicola]